ncbi:Translation initiation factor 3 subunit J component [Malassezia vespertilionis]|uniref:Translation initiation factor 3 subunit J component n=1 Tax=Malassezia vespertilionis TaxID=2020962 RepID=UPI0024B06F74|nr:Translation initiation factor 3 subunit J component [Malassezia vespertilionis]WFD05382.1 Translation initiation factor 3 subunit J component [Malassezia vespertilionis]
MSRTRANQQDDWDHDSEPEPAPKPAPPKPQAKAPSKPAAKEGVQLRRGIAGEETGFENFDAASGEEERRRREREAEMRSDLSNAADLFGAATLDENEGDEETAAPEPTKPAKKAPAPAAPSAPLAFANAKPATKEEWENYANDVYASLIKPKSSLSGFDKHFFPCMLALLTTNGVRDVDMRKGANKLRELAEAKVKADQEMKRTGGNVKGTVVVKAKPKQVGTASAKNTYDLKAYGKEALDDDDFM